jgi:hypothetical protein
MWYCNNKLGEFDISRMFGYSDPWRYDLLYRRAHPSSECEASMNPTMLMVSLAFVVLSANANESVTKNISPSEMAELKEAMKSYEQCVVENPGRNDDTTNAITCGVAGYAVRLTSDALKCPRSRGYVPDFMTRNGRLNRTYFYYCDNSEITSIALIKVNNRWLFSGAGRLVR